MTTRRNPWPAGARGRGALIVIGGAEEKDGNAEILGAIAKRVGDGRLVVMTCATEEPEAAWEKYRDAFRACGVRDLGHVDVRERREALDDERSRPIEGAAGVFFTGGDQLRITSHLGDTPAYRRIAALLDEGGIVAGTSAGAAVMSDTMLVDGQSETTPTIGEVVRLAPGLGFLQGAIVDMHFSERGRLGRLLGAIAQNSRMLGIGIDEDTAIEVSRSCLTVLGNGGVYITDGAKVTFSNVADASDDEVLTIDDVAVHLLNAGRRFDLAKRRPLPD
jgi:cyanophycinase